MFTSDTQFDTKERRRYELKLSKAPNLRTVIIAVLAFILIGTAAEAFGRELRVTTAVDLVRCAAGVLPLTAGPDAGAVAAPGDTCVVLPGTYTVGANIVVSLQNLTIRSAIGANATIVDLNTNRAVQIQRDGVTIGGPKTDQGLTFLNGPGAGAIQIGTGAPVGQADENITIQNNIIRNNNGPGITTVVPTSVELFKIFANTIRDNLGAGIAFLNGGSVGRRGQDRNVVIEQNFFEANLGPNILFGNGGSVEQTAILNNTINRSTAGSGIQFSNTGEVRDSLIVGNLVQFNFGFGIMFVNTGRVDNVLIKDNTGPTLDQGITRNLAGGIYFFLPVTEIRDVTIEGNNINSNQNGGFILGNGIATFVPGDIEGLALTNNNIRQNCSNGVLKLLGGDLIRSSFDSNKVFNNGFGIGAGCPVVGPSAGLIAINTTNNIQDNKFSGNEFRENSLTGVTLFTTTGDISRLSWTNDKFIKNTVRGLSIFAAATGDIADLSASGIEASENQAGPGTGADIRTLTGDMETFSFDNSKFNNNGGFGLRVISLGAPPARGDVDSVKISNSQFNFNGTRAPVGLGSGVLLSAESVRNVDVSNSMADNNNDHGFSATASRDMSLFKFDGSEFSNNDRNVDTIGNGIDISVNEAASDISVTNSKVNSNNSGIRITAQDRIGRNYVIENNPEINNNRDAGIDLFSGRDLDSVRIANNGLRSNAIGVRLDVQDRGTRINLTKNRIIGNNGVGVGVLLNSTGVSITENSIRNNATGIEARKVRDNKITKNNIARNENFGVNANSLSPGDSIDAKENWWGEPSGPKHATNPGGIGDRVTDKVTFVPFLTEPAFPTEASFQIESLTASKTDVTVGDSVNFNYKVKNTGTEENTQTVKITIKDGLGNVVLQTSRQVTVNPAGFREDVFSFIFQTPGEYTVTVETPDDSKSVKVTVAGEASCLPFALDNNPKNKVLDDAEIITAIDLWVKNGAVPGCSPPIKISDSQIIQLIDLWVKGSQLTVPLGSKMTAQSANLSVASSFATLGASVRQVRPGESFTVTVKLDAKDGISGLLLAQSVPTGWSVRPVELNGAYFKASENKWLWLNAKGTVSLSYEVTVPATAAPGVYTIAGRAKAAVPSIEAELAPMTVEVLGAPVALAVKAITLSQAPVRNSGAYFVVEGVGVAQTTVHVFTLTGKLVFSDSAQGNVVAFGKASELANGVYLYVVTVKGADGQTVRSRVEKLVILK
jgi:hypothetical protein